MEHKNYTPGPWHNDSKNSGYGPRHVCGPKHADGGDYAPICIANTEANARLIADAPALLAERDALRESHTRLLEAAKEMEYALENSVDKEDWRQNVMGPALRNMNIAIAAAEKLGAK